MSHTVNVVVETKPVGCHAMNGQCARTRRGSFDWKNCGSTLFRQIVEDDFEV